MTQKSFAAKENSTKDHLRIPLLSKRVEAFVTLPHTSAPLEGLYHKLGISWINNPHLANSPLKISSRPRLDHSISRHNEDTRQVIYDRQYGFNSSQQDIGFESFSPIGHQRNSSIHMQYLSGGVPQQRASAGPHEE
jgi:hypothetical protein